MTAPFSLGSPVIGIDLGGTNMQAAVLNTAGDIISRTHARTAPHEGEDRVIERLVDCARQAAADATVDFDDISAIGIAAPGAVDADTRIIVSAPNLGWTNVPLDKRVSATLDRPVYVENDVNAAVWGEYTSGAGRGFDNLLGAWVGTGVGGGVIMNGALFSGATSSAAEIGQTVVYHENEAGARIMEHHSGRLGMSRLVRCWAAEHADSTLPGLIDEHGIVATHAIAEAWKNGGTLATRVVEHAATCLGVAIANVVTMLAPEAVVIGGGVTEQLGQPFIDLVDAAFAEYVFPGRDTGAQPCTLVMTQLKADAGTLGAARLAAALTHK